MSRHMARPALVSALLVVATAALADSPLTSIDLATAYPDVPAVQAARAGDLEAAYGYLASTADNGSKLAVANALGWRGDFATGFFEFLASAQRAPPRSLELAQLDASQAFVAGFLVARADALHLKPLASKGRGVWRMTGEQLLQHAARQLPDDFAVHYALALVQAQRQLHAGDKRWCEVFSAPDAALRRFPEEKRNLRPAAVEAAQGYLSGYEAYCPASTVAKRKKREALNQVYSLSRAGRHVVAGTQGGVVVWDPEQPQPVAVREGFICRGLAWRGAAWVGCEGEVVRWDGAQLTSFLATTKKGQGVYFEPMRGPDDSLWVRRGKQTWSWDEAANRFVAVSPPWKGDVYDAHFWRDRWYWVEFKNSVRTPTRTFPLKSVNYPGADPRAFTEDETGALWVQDFEAGFFRYDGERFVKVPGVDGKGSGVAVDVERKRTWLLHYTDGLTLLRDGAPLERVALDELENMRALLLDPTTGDVWVGGWGQLVRLRADGPTWAKQRLVVR